MEEFKFEEPSKPREPIKPSKPREPIKPSKPRKLSVGRGGDMEQGIEFVAGAPRKEPEIKTEEQPKTTQTIDPSLKVKERDIVKEGQKLGEIKTPRTEKEIRAEAEEIINKHLQSTRSGKTTKKIP